MRYDGTPIYWMIPYLLAILGVRKIEARGLPTVVKIIENLKGAVDLTQYSMLLVIPSRSYGNMPGYTKFPEEMLSIGVMLT